VAIKHKLNFAIIVLMILSITLMHLDHIEDTIYFLLGAIFVELKIIELRGEKHGK